MPWKFFKAACRLSEGKGWRFFVETQVKTSVILYQCNSIVLVNYSYLKIKQVLISIWLHNPDNSVLQIIGCRNSSFATLNSWTLKCTIINNAQCLHGKQVSAIKTQINAHVNFSGCSRKNPHPPDGWDSGNSRGRGGQGPWKSRREGELNSKKSSVGVIWTDSSRDSNV